ncbi:hypothetical protein FJTKL_11155 [Diaporthe vaccinii]|uniref:Uncharacterized protein n=1 Tax=Diaporthe vaccinii TaxID=105482 RepID=A0ABR4EI39_9PEZI
MQFVPGKASQAMTGCAHPNPRAAADINHYVVGRVIVASWRGSSPRKKISNKISTQIINSVEPGPVYMVWPHALIRQCCHFATP